MDKIVIVALGTLIIALVVDNIRLRYKNHAFKIMAGQAVVDQTALANIISKELANQSEAIDQAKESHDAMINFLSTSRELAFEYIANAQSVVKEFVDKVGPHVRYYSKFGGVISSPHDKAMTDISEAFPKLESLLPEDHANETTGEV